MVPLAPVRVSSQRSLAPSVTSVAYDMILRVMHRFHGIYLTAEENPGKLQLGDRVMKGLCDQSLPQMGSLPPYKVSRIAEHVRKGEGRIEGKDEGYTNQ